MFRLTKEEKFTIAFAVVIIAGVIVGVYHLRRQEAEKGFATEVLSNKDEKILVEKLESKKILVHISGEVYKPGVYELDENSRVRDAVNCAGAKETADLDRLNLAAFLNDGDKIVVPKYDPSGGEFVPEKRAYVQLGQEHSLININTASREELESLPGIGPVYASRIIEYREKRKFNKIEDIKKVNGIGDKTFELIRDKISVR